MKAFEDMPQRAFARALVQASVRLARVVASLTIAFAAIVIVAGLAGCESASSVNSSQQDDSKPESEASSGTAPSATSALNPTYETEFFAVTLPDSWGNAWKVIVSEERRESMNASNYAYRFALDGEPQFTVECKLFSLDSTASIGSTGERQVEFYAADGIRPDDLAFVQSHIEVKAADGTTATNTAETAGKASETASSASSQTGSTSETSTTSSTGTASGTGAATGTGAASGSSSHRWTELADESGASSGTGSADVATGTGSPNIPEGTWGGYRVYHVRTADFEFDLPKYWEGKVEWFEETLSTGRSKVYISPLGMTDPASDDYDKFALVTVWATDSNAPKNDGDIGGGLVDHVDGSSKDVVMYQKNWAYLAQINGSNAIAGTKYTTEQLNRLLDLSTGGKYAYEDCRDGSNVMACLDYNKSQFEGKIKIGNFGASPSTPKTENTFVMPDTDYIDYNIRIWYDMDNHKLFLARNEVFARHGCGFKSSELREYFGKQAWYKETIDPGTYGDELLNSTEKLNVENILSVEKSQNSPYIK